MMMHLPSCVTIPGVVGDSGLLTSRLDLLLSDSERVIFTPPDVTTSPAGLRAAGSSPNHNKKTYIQTLYRASAKITVN